MRKNKDNGLKAIICLAVATVVVAGASIAVSLMDHGNNVQQGAFKNGTYTAQADPDENGNYGHVTITVEGGQVTNVVWDEVYGGASKLELAANGQYVMVEGNPTWKDQSEALGAYVVEHQSTEGLMSETNYGYTDAVSGVSIYIGGFIDLTNEALGQAENQ